MQDVTNMLLHIGRERRGGKDARALTHAFVTEYFADAPSGWEQRLAPHYAWALLGEAASAARSVAQSAARAAEDRARHEQRLSVLLEEAQTVLAAGAWLLDPAPDPIPGTGEAGEAAGRLEAHVTDTLAVADQRRMSRRARRSSRRAKRGARTEASEPVAGQE
jgi:hypothetical protein